MEIRKVAVVGSGSIGAAWAIVFARGGLAVSLYDTDPTQLDTAIVEIGERLSDLDGFGLLGEPPAAIAARIQPFPVLADAVKDAGWVQECAPENLEIKRALFAELDEISEATAILASSSSAMTVSSFVDDPAKRGRCLVVHPGNPPTLLPVAEVVPAPETDAHTCERTMTLLAAIGMKPVLVRKEIEGFVYNRLQGALLREAYCLVRDGVIDAEDIDVVVREGLGVRWSVIGPFETVDLNTRGGIAAHAERLGPAYARMGAERGQNDPWTRKLVANVVAARRRSMPMEQWDERRGWRDRMLMALSRAKRDALARFGT